MSLKQCTCLANTALSDDWHGDDGFHELWIMRPRFKLGVDEPG